MRDLLNRARRAGFYTVLTAAFCVLCGSAYAVDGFNLPGFDYADFSASSWLVCRNSCGGDANCRAWTWVKPGFPGGGRCWLKNGVGPLVKDSSCNSGSREYMSKEQQRAEDHTNRPGMDYRSFSANSWKLCEASCADEARCSAWTYVHAGVQGPTGVCWLKHGVPRPRDEQHRVSGVKFRPVPVLIDHGTQLNPVRD